MRDWRQLDELGEVGESYETGRKPGAVSLTAQVPGIRRKVAELPDAAARFDGGDGGGEGEAEPGAGLPITWLAGRAPDASGVFRHAPAAVSAAATSGGAPLPEDTRARFEASLGADLGGVRVHTGAASAAAARSMSAVAYASGNDIHFADGAYDPSSAGGERLLAHEVAHTVQQGGAGAAVQTKLEVGDPGDRAEADADAAADAMVAGRPYTVSASGGGALRRALSPHYADMVTRLSYAIDDWAVTDADAHQVLEWLDVLNPADFTDTCVQLKSDGKLGRLLGNISTADRSAYAALIARIELEQTRTISRADSMARIRSALEYGVFDWEITDADAHDVLEHLQAMPVDRRRLLVQQMAAGIHYDRLISNVSAADRVTYATLLAELETMRRGAADQLQGTALPGATAVAAVNTALNAGVSSNPITGAPDPFVDIDPVTGNSYRQDIEAALDGVRAWMHADSVAMMARPRMAMSRFEGVGEEAKRQTDAMFGGLASGPAFTTSGPSPNLIDRSLQPPSATALVRYLISNQEELFPVHQAHKGITSRGTVGDMTTELGIVTRIITDYSAAHTAELETIDQAWPAVAGGGVVEIQPFEGATPADTRSVLWESFQTMIHEYLHTITHPGYEQTARALGGTGESVLIEGGTSLFTDKVWNLIYPHEIATNDQLRLNVEGSALPFDASVIPPISHYAQIAQARDIEAACGEDNMRAAYFLGHTELLGLGTAYTPAAAASGPAYVVPAAGVATLADVATATGATESTIAAANGLAVGAAVTAGQSLTVPGIRVHIVREDGTETKAEIATRNGVTEADLDRANVGFSWAGLAPGQSIVIPVH